MSSPARWTRSSDCASRGGPARLSVGVVAATAEEPLELPGDRLTASLGQVGGVLGLLERLDILGDLFVTIGELVDAALPGPSVLIEIAVVDRCVKELL